MRAYRTGALILCNTLVVLVVVNVALYAVFAVHDRRAADADLVAAANTDYLRVGYSDEMLEALYPGMTRADVAEMLRECWSDVALYEPFTQFRPTARTGRFVSIAEPGYRHSKNQGPWPPDPDRLNVFVFGGSTVFNFGVADDQTIASHLQAYLAADTGLPVSVYNWGRCMHYSTLERIKFEALLVEGHVPDVAVFIDGLNEFYHKDDEPAFTPRLRKVFVKEAPVERSPWPSALATLPMARAARALRDRLAPEDEPEPVRETADDDSADAGVNRGIVARYFRTKSLIEAAAHAYGVTPVFVWQPVPMYKYDEDCHPFAMGGYGRHTRSIYGYPLAAEWVAGHPVGRNFLWLADMQEAAKEMLYVDVVHYSPEMSRRIARRIADYILDEGLLPGIAARSIDG